MFPDLSKERSGGFFLCSRIFQGKDPEAIFCVPGSFLWKILEPLGEAISPLKVRGSMKFWGVIKIIVMVMLMLILRAMASHMIEVLIRCWSGGVSGHGLTQGLGRDWTNFSLLEK